MNANKSADGKLTTIAFLWLKATATCPVVGELKILIGPCTTPPVTAISGSGWKSIRVVVKIAS